MGNATTGHLYGRGVFTTVAIVGGEPFLWAKHWRRLVHDAAALDLRLAFDAEEQIYSDLLAAGSGSVSNGRARIALRDESPSPLWAQADEPAGTVSVEILTAPLRKIGRSLDVTLSPFRVNSASPLAGLKSINYLDPVLSWEKVKKRGFDEGIRLNERGEVTSACMANVFWSKGGRLFTPALQTGCLPGTTRELVLETLDCEEVTAGIDDVRTSDAVFLTSAGIGIRQVRRLEERVFDRLDHSILELWPLNAKTRSHSERTP